MEAREAIAIAKKYVSELFGDERIANLGLEEITSNGDVWEVTIGFSRPWDAVRDAASVITGAPTLQRSYKKVQIRDSDQKLLGISNS